MTPPRTIAIFHEHPDWFRPLFAELDRRAIPHVRIDAAAHQYNPHERVTPYALVFNRASPSAYLRAHRQTTFHTLNWLRHLERLGTPVVNGADCYALELSKAWQIDVLEELGLPAPRTRVINHPSQAVDAAQDLRYPVLLKANVGGSGAGITSYANEAELARNVESGLLDFGVDGTALVQERAPLRGGHITRVETLGTRYLYAINVYPAEGFNLCPADVCQTTDGQDLVRGACAVDAPKNGMRVEGFTHIATRPLLGFLRRSVVSTRSSFKLGAPRRVRQAGLQTRRTSGLRHVRVHVAHRRAAVRRPERGGE